MKHETSRTHTLVVGSDDDWFVEHPGCPTTVVDGMYEEHCCLVQYIVNQTGIEDLKENDPDHFLATPGRYMIAGYSYDAESLFEDNELYLYFGKGDDLEPREGEGGVPERTHRSTAVPEAVVGGASSGGDPLTLERFGVAVVGAAVLGVTIAVLEHAVFGDLGRWVYLIVGVYAAVAMMWADGTFSEFRSRVCWCGKARSAECWKCEGKPESRRPGDDAR